MGGFKKAKRLSSCDKMEGGGAKLQVLLAARVRRCSRRVMVTMAVVMVMRARFYCESAE